MQQLFSACIRELEYKGRSAGAAGSLASSVGASDRPLGGHTVGMPRTTAAGSTTDIDAVTDAVLTASRLLVAVSARSITAAGDLITLPQFRLLVILQTRGPLKHVALAEYLGVNPSTATRMVDRLVAVGMVSREHNPASRREIALELTAEGARMVRQVTARRRKEIAKIVAKMPETARSGLVEVLSAFAQAGGEPPAGATLEAIWS
jgi:DNA-binding MarR family transcriptional regulator